MKRLSQINLILVLLAYLGLVKDNGILMFSALFLACSSLLFIRPLHHYGLVVIAFSLALAFMLIIANDIDYQNLDWFMVLTSLDLALYIEKIAYLKNIKAILSSYLMMIVFSLCLIFGLFLLKEAGIKTASLYRLALSSLLLVGPYIFGLSLVLMFREFQKRL